MKFIKTIFKCYFLLKFKIRIYDFFKQHFKLYIYDNYNVINLYFN